MVKGTGSRWVAMTFVAIALVVFLQSCTLITPQRQREPQASPTLPPSVPSELGIIWETWNILRQNQIDGDKLDAQKLSQAAVKAMLEASGDPYAAYLEPPQYAEEKEELSGTYEGIGAHVTSRGGRIIIVAPIAGTPAEKAGIRPGDAVVEIEGKSTEGLSLSDAIREIRGPRGTSVTIGIKHLGEEEVVHITLVRDIIRVVSVEVKTPAEDIAYIRLTTFGDNTIDELVSALEKIKGEKAKGLILDVRNNPGGLLDSVVRVSSQFLKDGLVLYEVDGQGKRTDWQVRRGGVAQDIPMVLLVNEFSASASEVLAGALRDHDRAKLVGTKTFGKGSVNNLRPLSDGSGIYFSVARWYTPNGILIEGKGLEPDIQVEAAKDPREDPQLVKAIEVLQQELAVVR